MLHRPPRLPITERWQTRKGLRRALRPYLRELYGVTSVTPIWRDARRPKHRQICGHVRRDRRAVAALEARMAAALARWEAEDAAIADGSA